MKLLNILISLFVFNSAHTLVCSHLSIDLIEKKISTSVPTCKKDVLPSPPPLRLKEDKRAPYEADADCYALLKNQ